LISGFKVEWSVGDRTGDDVPREMALAFERAGDELADFEAHLFPRLTPVFEQEMREQFDDEGHGPVAGAWAPLSEQYAEWKDKNYPGRPILQREGTLYEALTSSGSPFARRAYSGDTYDFGTIGVEYASYHQLGAEKLPPRPPFDMGDDFEKQLLQEGEAAAREAMEAAGADEYLEVTP
jgi:phage gpG-like protein